ncbi:MAG: hypothetical protein O3A13_03760 [Proteobacteria bacterium]|nr:hypothetical protein [Pseudomonadota bacterium]MDA0992731.1 hypothetical protein [Pseudomonadota bacterium]
MKDQGMKAGAAIVTIAVSIGLFGCGGTKILKEPEPLVVTQSLANSTDQRISATLDWVVVRGGPGTWAKNADWDEYLIRVRNVGDDSLQVTNVAVVDSLGTRVEAGTDRKQLVKGAKQAERRYKGQGLKVKAGAGAKTLMVSGAVTAAAVLSVGAAAAFGGPMLAGAALGGIVLAPVLAVGGVFRGVNNGKVSNQIEFRYTPMPVALKNGEESALNIFFPLSPSPRQIELTYVDSEGEHVIVVDTQAALNGLHLVPPPEK